MGKPDDIHNTYSPGPVFTQVCKSVLLYLIVMSCTETPGRKAPAGYTP